MRLQAKEDMGVVVFSEYDIVGFGRGEGGGEKLTFSLISFIHCFFLRLKGGWVFKSLKRGRRGRGEEMKGLGEGGRFFSRFKTVWRDSSAEAKGFKLYHQPRLEEGAFLQGWGCTCRDSRA